MRSIRELINSAERRLKEEHSLFKNSLRLHVKTKIQYGYSLIILLMAGIVLITSAGLLILLSLTGNLSGDLLMKKNLSQGIVNKVLSSQLYASRFARTNNQSDIDGFVEDSKILSENIQKASELVNDDRSKKDLAEIKDLTEKYNFHFQTVRNLVNEYKSIQSPTIDSQRLKIDSALSAIKISIVGAAGQESLLTFINIQGAYSLMEKSRLSYVQNSDEKDYILYEKGYSDLSGSIDKFANLMKNPDIARLTEELKNSAEKYDIVFDQAHANFSMIRGIMQDRLEPTGNQIIMKAENIHREIEKEYKLKNDFALFLVIVTFLSMLGASAASIMIAAKKAMSISQGITEPLEKVMTAIKQIAETDIELMISQMKTLTKGDIRLDMKFVTEKIGIDGEDEIGQTGKAFNVIIDRLHEAEESFSKMADYLVDMAAAAEKVAALDLDVSIDPRSENDILAAALNRMVYNLKYYQNDIADRKRTEEALRASEERFRSFVENANDIVYALDLEEKVLYASPNWTEQLGHPTEEILGKPFENFIGPENISHIKYCLEEISLTGEKQSGIEYRIQHRDGSWQWHTSNVSPLRNSSEKITAFLGISRNITERKLTEAKLHEVNKSLEEQTLLANEMAVRAESANAAKSEFLANMSHEIRTPLNAIIGLTELAMKTELTVRQRDYINKIRSSSRTLLGVINDILDFSKIEAGKLEIENIDFMLYDVVNTVSDLLSTRCSEKGLDFIISIDKDVPLILKGDPLRLSQVLTNLASNSLKFTDRGYIIIKVSTVNFEGNNVVLKFSVKDTGIGIPEEKIGNIFNAFTQTDGSITRKYGGTGLGLAISKKLVQMMDGNIEAMSKPGEGSTFSFTARLVLTQESAPVTSTVPDNLKNLNVMVIDDSEAIRMILKESLESFSFNVITAGSGEEAVKIISSGEHKFDIFFVDWKMPGMDGIETSQKIREAVNSTKTPFIIMISAYSRDEVMKQAHEAGIDCFLTKPINNSMLLDSIMEITGVTFKNPYRNISSGMTSSEQAVSAQDIKILLVEDSPLNQQITMEILRNEGFHVDIANNGLEAMHILKERAPSPQHYNIVLMDIQMPEMDGYQATEAIRNDPLLSNLVVIAMTANALKGDREKCLAAGMNDYISKPINFIEFFRVINKWIVHPEDQAMSSEKIQQAIDFPGRELLKNIDVEGAIKKLGNNISIYKTLLKNFHSSKKDTESKLDEALKNNDYPSAERIFHTIKGISGNIGSFELSKISATLEEIFLKNPGALRENDLSAFNKTYSEIEKIIEDWIDFMDKNGPVQSNTGNEALIPEILKELGSYLAESNFSAYKKAEEFVSAAKGTEWEKFSEELFKWVAEFKMTEAKEILDRQLEEKNISF